MEQHRPIYETTFIVNAGLDDAQIDAVIEKAKEVVVKNGGEIRDLFKWGRKRFTYPIRKKNNGFYVVFEFSAPGDVIGKLERHYQLDENVIRYLTIVLDKKALKARVAPSELVKQSPTEPAVAETRVQAPPPPPTPLPAPAPVPAPARPGMAVKEEDDGDDDAT